MMALSLFFIFTNIWILCACEEDVFGAFSCHACIYEVSLPCFPLFHFVFVFVFQSISEFCRRCVEGERREGVDEIIDWEEAGSLSLVIYPFGPWAHRRRIADRILNPRR